MRIVGNYGTSLLDYLNNDSSSTDSLTSLCGSSLSAAAKKTLAAHGISLSGTTYSNSSQISGVYSKIKTATESLRNHSVSLTDTDSDSLFAKAEASGDTTKVVSEVSSFVEDYNSMVSSMTSMGGTVNSTYLKELSSTIASNKDALKNVGITQNDDGTLTIESDKLKKASLVNLKALFNGSKAITDKISIKSIYVEANAISANAQSSYSASDSYTGKGNYSTNSALSSFLESI